ncbi:MAG: hypothetical protein HW390_1313 [Candidatus Brocadiaceae bacterium]|nr:hypothetical protein [Candidatus Brocadiaceae bacterium]
MSTFQILHLSDLHVSAQGNFDRSVVLDPLITRIKEDLTNGFRPEIVIMSGDVAFSGKTEEYAQAKVFFDKLLTALKLLPQDLFIVPGNHDVDCSEYAQGESLNFSDMKAMNDLLESNKLRERCFVGMDNYFQFIETHYNHLASKQGKLIPFVSHRITRCNKHVGIVGLNSAWMCRNSSEKEKELIAIGEYQIKNAHAELKALGEFDLAINVFHHPLGWLWNVDERVCRANFKALEAPELLLLSGHLHEPNAGYSIDTQGGRFYQFQAGGVYTGSESIESYQSRFQYITVDWDKKKIRLDFRRFAGGKRVWCVDAESGEDGRIEYGMAGAVNSAQKNLKTPEPLPEIPENYRSWLSEHCAYMDIDKLRGKSEVIQVKLPEVFVPLFADGPGKKAGRGRNTEDTARPVNIETLIKEKEFLLIEGHPGSGKTTLLKHLAYGVAQTPPQAEGFAGWLPILLFLKDLNGFFADHADVKSSPSTAEKILAFYCEMTGSGLSLEMIKAFCKRKKTLFLLDGLDEIEESQRNVVVRSFADFRTQNVGNKLVLSGRPHGAAGAAADRFGANHVKILPLNSEQTESFIRNWFRYVYAENSRIGSKTADGMISEIQTHPSIGQLIDNPLMLTAISILYHDGKELPGQRAELYNKFVENMLYRRFPDYEKVREFLMELAFDMHYNRRTKGIDKQDALKVLQKVYKKLSDVNEALDRLHALQKSKESPDETEALYRKRTEKLFDEIESRCGLIKYESGQYLFWHLTFQEFLTAVCVKDNNNYEDTLGQKWGEAWHHEAIELYIGYQSINDKSIANTLMDEAIRAEDIAPFGKWLLASKSMLDVHKDRRNDEVLNKVKERLLDIMDSDAEPKARAEAGEILGWLGDTRNLKEFIRVEDGEYSTSIGTVTIKNLEMGKYPVTNGWFEEFVKAGGYKCKDYWGDEGWQWLEQNKAEQPRFWNERTWRCPNAPVVGVSWYEACAFTQWLMETLKDGFTYKLLEEGEWEAAAAGLKKREYPWGDAWDNTRCNNGELKIGKTSTVGIFKKGDTPEGISDMSGNVWEWTVSLYDKENPFRVVRGGSWLNVGDFCRCAYRRRVRPDRGEQRPRFSLRQDSLDFIPFTIFPLYRRRRAKISLKIPKI